MPISMLSLLFTNPRNVGEIENASGIGEVGNVKCGDIMRMYLKIEDNTIEDVKFKTFGCGSAIASSSMATELIKGKTIEEAMDLTTTWLLPDQKCVRRRSHLQGRRTDLHHSASSSTA